MTPLATHHVLIVLVHARLGSCMYTCTAAATGDQHTLTNFPERVVRPTICAARVSGPSDADCTGQGSPPPASIFSSRRATTRALQSVNIRALLRLLRLQSLCTTRLQAKRNKPSGRTQLYHTTLKPAASRSQRLEPVLPPSCFSHRLENLTAPVHQRTV